MCGADPHTVAQASWTLRDLARCRNSEGDQARAHASRKAPAKTREEQLVTLEQVAERARLHAKHLQRIEAGTANPSLASLVAIASAYKMTLAELFGG